MDTIKTILKISLNKKRILFFKLIKTLSLQIFLIRKTLIEILQFASYNFISKKKL